MKIAFFDFDGTITYHDTFMTFALFSKGKTKFAKALVRSLPKLIAWKMRLCSNSEAKECLFRHLYEGMCHEEFQRHCALFIDRINLDLRLETMESMQWHKSQGHTVAIVSASIGDWIRPWGESAGVDHVLATEVEVALDGKLTGCFSTPNCHGKEKVRRIKEFFHLGPDDEVWAYGDSAGDDEMLGIADHPLRV